MTTPTFDAEALESKIKQMYQAVAEEPFGHYHFEMGRALAEGLGYPSELLDRIPSEAVDSFAGVGYFFDLAGIEPGDEVLDLGSGSGTDTFVAALLAGEEGFVTGIDITPAQVAKATRLQQAMGVERVTFTEARIEQPPLPDSSVDVVISNGVVNLSPRKLQVFAEAARVLRPGGCLALADILTERPLTEAIVGNPDLWAACIGGAAHVQTYQETIEQAGLRLEVMKRNPYQFVSPQARRASDEYGVVSMSLLARKPDGDAAPPSLAV